MRNFGGVRLLVAVLFGSALSFSQTIFDVNATLSGLPLSLNGTLSINSATGTITNWDISLPPVPGFPSVTLTPNDSFVEVGPLSLDQGVGNRYTVIYFFTNAGNLELLLIVDGRNLQGFNGSPILTSAQEWGGRAYSEYRGVQITGGSISLAPEPSSLVLAGSGLAALAAWRRKVRTKAPNVESHCHR